MAGLLDISEDQLLGGLLGAGAASGARGNFLSRMAAGLQAGDRFRQGRQEQARQRSQDEMRAEYQKLQMLKAQRDAEREQAAAAQEGFNTNAILGGLGNTDPREFLQKNPNASISGLEQFLKLNQAMTPKREILTGKPGDVFFDKNDPTKMLGSVPDRPAAPEKDPEVIRQLKIIYGEGTPAYRSALLRLGAKATSHQPPTTVTYGSPMAATDAQGNQVFIQPSKTGGSPAVMPGFTPPKNQSTAQPSEGERKAATLLQRLRGSQEQLSQAVRDDPSAQKPSLISRAAGHVSTDAENALNSPARQRVEAAQLDMLDAALTLGTGAAYTKEQLIGYRQAYFPQVGDGPSTIKDKAARLQNVIKAAEIAAGRSAKDVPTQQSDESDPLGLFRK